MSDLVESIKDFISPSRREEATAPVYDPKKRGPHAVDPEHQKPSEQQVDPPKAAPPKLEEQAAVVQTGEKLREEGKEAPKGVVTDQTTEHDHAGNNTGTLPL